MNQETFRIPTRLYPHLTTIIIEGQTKEKKKNNFLGMIYQIICLSVTTIELELINCWLDALIRQKGKDAAICYK